MKIALILLGFWVVTTSPSFALSARCTWNNYYDMTYERDLLKPNNLNKAKITGPNKTVDSDTVTFINLDTAKPVWKEKGIELVKIFHGDRMSLSGVYPGSNNLFTYTIFFDENVFSFTKALYGGFGNNEPRVMMAMGHCK